MRYVQLRAFHHVAISGGFSRAANELGLTQPAISDQVRKLEEEYDVLLFSRQHKQVALTPMGETLLAITHRLFDAEGQALELLSESRALRMGALRLVADSVHHILHVLSAFREAYPGVQMTVQAGNTETVLARLLSYEADLGVLGDTTPRRDFEIVPLNATPIIAFVAAGHPLAARRSLSLADLAGLPLVMREHGSRTRRLLEQRAVETGVALRHAIEVEGREGVRDVVAAGAGIGFVSEAEFGEGHGLARIALDGPPILMKEALICLSERNQSKAIKAFLDIARRHRAEARTRS
ncbi:LysR substrate-binding domain-containing protein [Bosea sp. 124]|uniref:LysR substrate-binding domain-containing protein n=1 Tax=Bosea sp. 124 TaxID=2135642 RepID=UPI000D33354B|nr:LysR substrate-binding domain-containing protein [Bosea sp. 124]PTM41433.1 aminoethylphosphonate catabolism LysR family transcriptional regulator [Bosea sp. 124]